MKKNKRLMKKIIAAIFTVFFTLPVLAVGVQVVENPAIDPTMDGHSYTPPSQALSLKRPPAISATRPTPKTNPSQEQPTQQSEKSGKNIFQKAGDGISKGAKAVGKGVTNAWNATSNFVSGIFKGAEPCSDDADKKLKDKVKCPAGKCTDSTSSLVEKTKLDTKQTGFKEGNKEENGEPKAGKCVIAKCIKGWVVNDTKDGCEQSEGDCTDKAKEMHQKATAGELKKGKCQITECEYGWHVSDDAQTCEQAELSEADSKQKVADLKDNAQKMKDKEQSTANKLLGGAAIGATGIGAMNLASGLAEQKADSAAEEDMKAYLATFVCDYGRGRNIKGGETNIDLPGGNDLFTAVNEYRALAADLKIRKEALGKQPGIESEVIIDAADTGLYDNVGLGRQSGAYTSLSRALTDETGKDAEEWAKQKADTASKVKTGAITAAAGAIGGMIGNLAINSGEKNKNKVDEINKKYEGLKQPLLKLEQEVKKIPPSPDPTKCPSNATGTYPNCKCTDNNAVHSSENICVECGDNEEPNAEGKQCVCRQGYSGTPCVEIPKAVTPKCNINEENRKNVYIDKNNGNCTCVNTFPDVPTCACDPKTHVWQNNTCTEKITQEKLTITLPAASLFDTGKSDLKQEAQTALTDFITSFNAWFAQNPNAPHCIKITGHTDKTGGKKINQPLSEQRAKAVEDYLSQNEIATKQLKSEGVRDKQCNDTDDQPKCRKVTIMVDKLNCDGSGAANNASLSQLPQTISTDNKNIVTTLPNSLSGNATDTWPSEVINKIADINAVNQVGNYCNNYKQNGIQGHFILDYYYSFPGASGYGGHAGQPYIRALCIFTKPSTANLTIGKNNLYSSARAYNGETYTLNNSAFAEAPAQTEFKNITNKYNDIYISSDITNDKNSRTKIGHDYIINVKETNVSLQGNNTPLTDAEIRNIYPTVVKTCEGYDQNGVQGVFAVEDEINERGIQRFVCLFIKKANSTETIESQINNTNTSQLLSPEDRESDRAILRKAAREGYVYDRDSVGQRCKKLFKNEGSWRGQFPDSPYYGCRFSHIHN